jgi:hypothetical protein
MAWLPYVLMLSGAAAGIMAILTGLRGKSARTVLAWTILTVALIGPVVVSFLMLHAGD